MTDDPTPPDPTDEATQKALGVTRQAINDQFDGIYKGLVDHAVTKAARLPSVRGGELPVGHRAEDAVQTAVERVWNGTRRWNRERYPRLVDFLTSVVDSVISDLVRGEEHKRRGGLPPGDPTAPDPSLSALDRVASDECHEALVQAVEDATADDPMLRQTLTMLLEGSTPGEIARELRIDRTEVYNALRKVKRRLSKTLAEHPCWATEADH